MLSGGSLEPLGPMACLLRVAQVGTSLAADCLVRAVTSNCPVCAGTVATGSKSLASQQGSVSIPPGNCCEMVFFSQTIGTQILITQTQCRAVDQLAWGSMKNAAKCVT